MGHLRDILSRLDAGDLRGARERLAADGGEVGAEDLEIEPAILPRGARIADGVDTPLALLREIVGWLDEEALVVIDDASTDPTDPTHHMAWRIRSCLARYDGPA